MQFRFIHKFINLLFLLGLSHVVFATLELNEPGKLYVATTGEFPPFSMVNDKGTLCGLETDLIKEICIRLDLQYIPVIAKWDSILIGVLSGKFDMSTEAMDITPLRSQQVLFVNWIQSSGVFVTKDKPLVDSFEDIKNKKIGVLIASSYETEAKRLGIKNILYYQYQTMALMDLINGNIDYVITDQINAEYFSKISSQKIKALNIENLKAQKGWAFHKNRRNLYLAIKKELERMYLDGTYQKIMMKYIDHNPYPEK